jgi:hypothetical protein
MAACRATLRAGLCIHASEIGGSVPVHHGLHAARGRGIAQPQVLETGDSIARARE